MSTSATQSGTTTGAGRSGKGLGFAAAALAVVIAAGFVFALNQGNGATVSDALTPAEIAAVRHAERVQQLEAAYQASTRPDPAAELERLNDLAVQVQAESHPAFNIERTKMGLAGTLDGPTVVPDADIWEYKQFRAEQLAAARAVEHPGVSPEKTRMAYLIDRPVVSPEKIRMDYLIDKLDEVMPSFGEQPAELDQPEWDNRMP
jgi:hypothetical protein